MLKGATVEMVEKMKNRVIHTRIRNIVNAHEHNDFNEEIGRFYATYLRCIMGLSNEYEKNVDELENIYDNIINLCKKFGFEIAD